MEVGRHTRCQAVAVVTVGYPPAEVIGVEVDGDGCMVGSSIWQIAQRMESGAAPAINPRISHE